MFAEINRIKLQKKTYLLFFYDYNTSENVKI